MQPIIKEIYRKCAVKLNLYSWNESRFVASIHDGESENSPSQHNVESGVDLRLHGTGKRCSLGR